MKKISYFFECYFNQSEGFEDLEEVVKDYKNTESPNSLRDLIIELYQIIQTKSYALAARIIKKYGQRTLDLEKAEKFINFLYDRFIDRPTDVKAGDFKRNVKVVFCPVCCPDLKKSQPGNLIDKATIIEKNMRIYICKPCKLVWLTEDIRVDNAQDYKKFMKSLGLKGLWKELSDVDIL